MAKVFSDENFESEVLNSDVPVLVDFFAEWCGPCKMMGPVVDKIAQEYKGKAKVGKIDIDKNPGLAGKYNVMSVPTFMVFKQGKIVDTVIGAVSKEELTKNL